MKTINSNRNLLTAAGMYPSLPFKSTLEPLEMNGCGNNFLIVDARGEGTLDPSFVSQVRDAITSSEEAGFDQMLVLHEGGEGVDAVMSMYNADGSSSQACGNGARCVAFLLGKERVGAKITLQAGARRIFCEITDDERVRVDMGAPEWNPKAIPLVLSKPVEDSSNLDPEWFPISESRNADIVGAVSMGNPHGVFFFDEATVLDSIDLETVGSRLERNEAFTDRANISFVHAEARDSLRLRVWERGAGATLCCGTAACAVHAIARRHDLCDEESRVYLPGGSLDIYQRESDEHIFMSGHAAFGWKKPGHKNVVEPSEAAPSQAA